MSNTDTVGDGIGLCSISHPSSDMTQEEIDNMPELNTDSLEEVEIELPDEFFEGKESF